MGETELIMHNGTHLVLSKNSIAGSLPTATFHEENVLTLTIFVVRVLSFIGLKKSLATCCDISVGFEPGFGE